MNAEQPASWRAFTKPPSRRAQPKEPVALDFVARAQDFLKRITSLCRSRHPRAHAHPRPSKTSQNLPSRGSQAQSRAFLSHRQARPLQVPQRDPRRRARSLGLAPKKNAFRPALQLSRTRSRRNPRAQRRLPRAHSPRPIQSHPARSRSLHPNGSRTLGQLKTRQAPGTSFEPYPIPVLADPKKIIHALAQLRDLKSFPSADAVNTTTGPQLPKYVSAAFGSLDLPWKPGHLRQRLRRHLLPQVQTQEYHRRYLPRPSPRP
jgi:hypothetical protein